MPVIYSANTRSSVEHKFLCGLDDFPIFTHALDPTLLSCGIFKQYTAYSIALEDCGSITEASGEVGKTKACVSDAPSPIEAMW